jgi:hypothetical protein
MGATATMPSTDGVTTGMRNKYETDGTHHGGDRQGAEMKGAEHDGHR